VACALRALELVRLPLLLGYAITDRRALIDADVRRWREVQGGGGLLKLLGQPEFRTLFYHRLRHGNLIGRVFQQLARAVYRGQLALYLATPDIGPGLYIQHGFATIVAARRMGANCWVNQQVTIGYASRTDTPTLEDGVRVGAGAIVLGDITLGAGCRVGAGAVVLHDVPADATAVGVPARVLPRNSDT
jgi:serine O-acetyltransferase